MLYRAPGGLLAKWEDEVFVDSAGLATHWLNTLASDSVSVMTAKAALLSTPNPAIFQVKKFREFATATIVLEQKRGGQADVEAYPMEDWQNAGVQAQVPVVAAGFCRLRLVSYVPPFSAEGGANVVSIGVALRIFVDRTQVASRAR
jgi:hypothetical protein